MAKLTYKDFCTIRKEIEDKKLLNMKDFQHAFKDLVESKKLEVYVSGIPDRKGASYEVVVFDKGVLKAKAESDKILDAFFQVLGTLFDVLPESLKPRPAVTRLLDVEGWDDDDTGETATTEDIYG